jgi:hypothetical protein
MQICQPKKISVFAIIIIIWQIIRLACVGEDSKQNDHARARRYRIHQFFGVLPILLGSTSQCHQPAVRTELDVCLVNLRVYYVIKQDAFYGHHAVAFYGRWKHCGVCRHAKDLLPVHPLWATGRRLRICVGRSFLLWYVANYALMAQPSLLPVCLILTEKNRPATFKYPFYSLAGDFRMFYELLFCQRSFDESEPASDTVVVTADSAAPTEGSALLA